jgi:hypothetical protein
MVYTQNEKDRMARLLEAFSDYIAESREMDVAYSEKTGYVRLVTDEYADPVFFELKDSEDLLDMLFYDILCDMVAQALDKNPGMTNSEMNYPGVFLHICGYLRRLDQDRAYATEQLRHFIQKWMGSALLP